MKKTLITVTSIFFVFLVVSIFTPIIPHWEFIQTSYTPCNYKGCYEDTFGGSMGFKFYELDEFLRLVIK